MNCKNCGGAMELFAARGYFFCRYCGSFHFPDTASDGGIRVLGEVPASSCSVCSQPLASATLDDAHPVRYCRNCRGALLPRTSFAAVVQQRRAWALDTPGPAVPLNRDELGRKMTCPACARAMTTHPYYGPGNVVIDSCESCELVWLDFGELEQIVRAPGKDRGTRGLPRAVAGDALGNSITGARLVGGNGGDTDEDDILTLLDRLF
jgi:Zn-finger nucleic acid-binding protein